MNLKAGDIFNSYKDLCMHLGEPVKSGSSKTAQEKLWRTKFEWKKEKNKIMILRVFEKEISDRLQLKNTSHRELCMIILASVIYCELAEKQEESGTVVFKERNMHLLLGLVNKTYVKKPIFRHCSNVERVFFSELRKKNFEVINYVVGQLDNKNISVFLSTYEIKFETENGMVSAILDEDGAAEVMRYYSRTIKKLGCKDMWQIHKKGLINIFYKELESLLRQKMGIIHHEKVYCFTSNLEMLWIFLEEYAKNNIIKLTINQSNQINVKRLKAHYEKLYYKYIEMKKSDYKGFRTEFYETFPESDYIERNFLIDKYVNIINDDLLNQKLPDNFAFSI